MESKPVLFIVLACINKMESKAFEEYKPQQPIGCEDLCDESNAAIRLFMRAY